ncbi:MAG: FG-GAP repeat protein [Sphingobacterium sp.]|nr:FG-GAP repeat protein [Sphingobacterium sp.]
MDASDEFGSSVSLDGNRLAVGARKDYGFNNSTFTPGAVYLYSFSDNNFSGGNLEAIIGRGYTGGKNISFPLEYGDNFGSSVSLSGNRLAVGAYGDSGFNNLRGSSGAVYLYSFSDSLFSGGNLESIIGFGYTGGKNINQNLDRYDYFGWSASLDGNRLAVGANGDDGLSNANTNSGIVYLYSFSDPVFSNIISEGNISNGNLWAKMNNQTLDNDDYSGNAVSLNGNRLAVGAYGDDGFNNLRGDSGAVYLYSFSDAQFSKGVLEAIIGDGFTGGKNINQTLDGNDQFGWSAVP